MNLSRKSNHSIS